jgi:hypothetical protein
MRLRGGGAPKGSPGVLAMQAPGVRVLTASGEGLTNSDGPAKVMMRQIAGAFAQHEKARLMAKLKGARSRCLRWPGFGTSLSSTPRAAARTP